MSNLQVRNNAHALIAAVMKRGLTASQAADAAGIHRDTFSRLLKRNQKINLRTAANLQREFGADVVTVVDSEQI